MQDNASPMRTWKFGFVALALAACGDGADGDANAGVAAAENSVSAETGLDFDASTIDVMSVDVAAGGVEPMVDPATADAGIDMLGQNNKPPEPDLPDVTPDEDL